MSHSQEQMISTDIEQTLKHHEHKNLLRFITCGSLNDGKSTLIGRLLYDSQMLFMDQLVALQNDSRKWSTQEGDIDLALLVDSLAAEREQGNTIDVAYRYFSTDKRKFILADTPGHEQYTRNMITGASSADLAVILIDASQGVLTQTRRHTHLVSLIGIRHVVLAINKMDLVGYSHEVFERIVEDYREFADKLAIENCVAIPISALKGDNIVRPSKAMDWYHGSTLMGYLETVEIDDTRMQRAPFRLPVQWVNHPNPDFRGFSGYVASGTIRPGDRIRVQPLGKESRVTRIVTDEGDLSHAVAGQSITLTLEDEIDISRGSVISTVDAPAEVADQFEARIVWMHEQPLYPGRTYLMKIGTNTINAVITDIKYQINVNTLEHLAADKLDLNGIAVCNIGLDRSIPFDPYELNRDVGGFILIDRLSNNTVGAGMINYALRRAHNIHLQHLDIDKEARSAQKGHKPCVLWFTGLSGSGKSTVANLVEKKLFNLGAHTYLLDGDNVRHGLNRDLGFTTADRVENIRRVAELSKLMVDAGLIVLTAFISPFRSERRMARELLPEGEFIEVFMDTPLEIAEQRDPKGLYKKARRGDLKNFTGIDSPYESPEAAEIRIDTSTLSAEEGADRIIGLLRERGVLNS
ncbi:sulfate adenylyltransferase subunit CysN [Thioalkalivibrio sulfidiphilus]|uniref:sulfate adenylyltransferase subunit CysN n=1 Tax=Thioalkalivibrio sulfidiphilus TaxID=1033854 RepID=UPI000370BF5A|nr:sulfate adenylyltransferase subunit CysN [Thioalkalivibrio sulfidiphilus]